MFTKDNLNDVLEILKNELIKEDSVFFSEAYLQLLFAMEVLKINENGKPRFKCMPEYPIHLGSDKYEIDLLIHDLEKKENTIIEFKYKTLNTKAASKTSLSIPTILGQNFQPKSHMAHDLGRYDVLHDLVRTRKVIDDSSINVQNGFMVFITNDHNYWKAVKSDKTSTNNKTYKYGTNFHLRDGRELKVGDELDWEHPIDSETKEPKDITNSIGKARNSPIKICKEYKIDWEDYYRLKRCTNDEINLFRILKLEA